VTSMGVSAQRHIQDIRCADVVALKDRFSVGSRVLELGGGNGYQATLLASWGCHVTSIDVALPPPGETVFFPVQLYDGRQIPFPDDTFDMVYSSCVLEHVSGLASLLRETRRVLKASGSAVHIVPSTWWRFWTSAAHYPHLMLRLLKLGQSAIGGTAGLPHVGAKGVGTAWRRLRRVLYAPAHGEYPSAFAELYYYSRRRWTRVFEDAGLTVQHVAGNGLFHTGYRLLPFLGPGPRRALAAILGSPTHVFTVRQR